MPPDRPASSPALPLKGGALLILLVGFGGLLALIVVSSLDALLFLRRIEATNNLLHHEFLLRNRSLNEIRSSLYLAGTVARDYLLDPDGRTADTHRASMNSLRQSSTAQLAAYAREPRPGETGASRKLEADLAAFWDTLTPVLLWTAEQRRARGYAFLNDEVYPRRSDMLRLTDDLSSLNEGRLHAGDETIAAMFADFRSRLILTLAISLALGGLLAAISIVNTLRLERESRERYQEIEQARGQLKELSARLLEAQEQERRSISRELHDEVGQALSAVLLEIGGISNSLPADHRPRLDSVKKLAESTMTVVRNMALLLRPSMLDDIGLLPALRWQAREVTRRTGLRVDVASDSEFTDLPEEHKTCVFRVVQEALNNSSRHAHGTVCRVTLRQKGDGLHLAIQDDGQGLDVDHDRGLGLLGIQERVARLGGSMRLESAQGRGTLLAIQLPIASSGKLFAAPAK
jgi:signal transduction histidine kinase